MTTLRELLIEELQDLFHAEKQLIKALPKMAKAATNEELKAGFTEHLAQTEGHVTRLEKAFAALGEPAKAKTCPAMKGLIEEGNEAISENECSPVLDAQLIGSAQRVEHYEIAAYGTARSFAESLGETEVAALLQETLDEEGETNKKLTALSETVNAEALAVSAVELDDDEKE
jgi:ferritin-like metal-binding protein YciE